MPRRKAATNCKISPWLSARPDNKERRFIQVGDTFLLSDRVKELNNGAFRLYVCMAMEAGMNTVFTFPASSAKKCGFTSNNGFELAKKELIEAGFIRIKSSGKCTREKNIYEFCYDWKARPP